MKFHKISILFLLLLLGASYGLYKLSYEVEALERKLVSLNRELMDSQRSIRVLEAEWSYLNRPENLQELAYRYLPLEPMLPSQIVADLGEVPALLRMARDDFPLPRARPDGIRPGLPGPRMTVAEMRKTAEQPVRRVRPINARLYQWLEERP